MEKKKYIYLGNIKSKIDWGYAKEYVEYAWKIMQQKKPDFYVIGSGKNNSVEYFVNTFVKRTSLFTGLYLFLNSGKTS